MASTVQVPDRVGWGWGGAGSERRSHQSWWWRVSGNSGEIELEVRQVGFPSCRPPRGHSYIPSKELAQNPEKENTS